MTAMLHAVPNRDERSLPHDLDAEAAVLAAILLEGAVAIDRVATLLRGEHFYSEANRRIFEAAQHVREAERPIDLVTVVAVLRDRQRLAQVGGAAYVAQLVDATPSTSNLEAHALIVLEKARVRNLIAQCQKLAALGYANEDPENFTKRVKQEIDDACARDQASSGRMFGAAVSEMYQKLIARNATKLGMGLPTGFIELDECTTGLHPAEVTYVAGRPGMGKTSLVLCVARNVAYGNTDLFNREAEVKDVVAIFSLEMPEDQVLLRMACIDGGIDSQRLRRDELTDAEWNGFVSACDRMSAMPIWVDDKPLDLIRMRDELRKLKAWCAARGKRLRLAIVDYIGLMDGPGKNEYERITENSKGLKRLSKELELPIMALCQLNRDVEERDEKRPELSDLRGSGALEQDADNVWFVFREDYYKPKGEPPNGEAEILIAKQRNGPFPRVARTKFYAGCTRFENA